MEMWESKFSLFPAFCQANFAFIVVPRKKNSEKSLKTIFMSFWTTFFGNFAWNIFFFFKKVQGKFWIFGNFFFQNVAENYFFDVSSNFRIFFLNKNLSRGDPKGKFEILCEKFFFRKICLKLRKNHFEYILGNKNLFGPNLLGVPHLP